jgi:hypothetical protein
VPTGNQGNNSEFQLAGVFSGWSATSRNCVTVTIWMFSNLPTFNKCLSPLMMESDFAAYLQTRRMSLGPDKSKHGDPRSGNILGYGE